MTSVTMASTLPHPHSADKPMFVPPQKRRTASGRTGTFTPSRSAPKSVIYGDQILNVQGRKSGSSIENLDIDRDVLGSLEKLHTSMSGTLGTMRSIRSNGSIPTLERVRREESNHSIGSHSQTSSGQVSERSTDIDLVREAVHQKRSLRASAASARRTSSKSSVRIPSANTSTDNLDTISVVERQTAETPGTSGRDRVRTLQARPLPELPPAPASKPASETDSGAVTTSNPELEDLNASLSKFQMRINANEEAIEILNTESAKSDPIGGHGVSVSLKHNEEPHSHEKASLIGQQAGNGFLTVTGTIKNGKNKGECFDVHLKMNRDRLASIEKEANLKKSSSCCCGLNRGLHIFFTSLILVPFLWIFCTFYAFYMGTITWYNIFIYYNEQRSCCHTIFVSPFVLLLYPVWIIPVTFGLGIYGGFSQISWYWPNWRKELTDPEKGFFGWLCNKLRIPDCSPYQVVILTSLGSEDPSTLTSVI